MNSAYCARESTPRHCLRSVRLSQSNLGFCSYARSDLPPHYCPTTRIHPIEFPGYLRIDSFVQKCSLEFPTKFA